MASGFAFDPFHWSESLLHSIGRGINRMTELPVNNNLARLAEEGRWKLQREGTDDGDSGEVIAMYTPPGGSHQRVCPDWLLPLVLGLSGSPRGI
ncbi:virion protein 3 [Sus scrofa polyomavirus 1]|nr:virion protein 3 [Sus scrofa polyomavirus 1]AKQ44352.1 virion protein 3 [Sus scrofa polyomavirus 1]